MELRHLRAFVAVAEELHFSRAAERLHMAQPPLSQLIRRLEREVGTPLFTRNRRTVALTEAGTAMLDHAREALDSAERAADLARAASAGRAGLLDVGFLATAALELLPRVLPAWRAAVPGARLRLTEGTSLGQLEALARRRLDVAFVRPPARGDSLRAEVVWRERVLAALPPGHPCAGRPGLSLGELRDEPFVSFPRASAPEFHDQLTAACERAGFTPRTPQLAGAMPSILGLVAAGQGVALVPASLRHLALPGVTYHRLDEPVHAEIAMVWHRANDRALLERFRAHVRDILRNGPV